MKIRGAIFDMDGTLVDSMFMWDELGKIYVENKGKVPEDGLTKMLSRMSMRQAADYLKKNYGLQETPEEIIAEIYGIMEDFYRKEVKEKPGIRKVLEDLKAAGVVMCVASATDSYMVEYALECVGIRKYFQSVFCCREVGEGKHSDKIYQVARENLGTQVEETVVFEDALHAAETAKRAGFPLVAVWDVSEKEQERMKELGDIYMTDYEQWDDLKGRLSETFGK